MAKLLSLSRQVCITWLCLSVSLYAADWVTFGSDPQRSGSPFNERILTVKNVGGLELKWKVKVNNAPKSLTALTAPTVAGDVITAQGIKTLVYVAASSNHLFALDAESGKIIWSKTFDTHVAAKEEDSWLCPQGINATPTIDKDKGIIYAIAMDGRLYGLDLGTGRIRFGPIQFVPPFSKNWSLNLHEEVIYTTLSQNCGGAQSGIYAMEVKDPLRPVVRNLLVSDGLKGGPSGIWGRGGPVIGKDNRIYVAVGDGPYDPSRGRWGSSIIAASLPHLKVVDYYTPVNWEEINEADWDLGATSPVWFADKDYNLLAVGAKEGVVYLMDAESLGGKDHQTPLYITPRLANDEDTFQGKGVWGGLSAWKDDQGQTWVYVPIWGPVSQHAPKFPKTNGPNPNGSIMAFKVATNGTTRRPVLEPVWISGDFRVPEPVVITNGVVLALSNGENVQQTKGEDYTLLTDAERKANTHHVILYVLDAKTGKVLFESGTAIDDWAHFSGLALANGRIYVVDHSSQVYCFGLKDSETKQRRN